MSYVSYVEEAAFRELWLSIVYDQKKIRPISRRRRDINNKERSHIRLMIDAYRVQKVAFSLISIVQRKYPKVPVR